MNGKDTKSQLGSFSKNIRLIAALCAAMALGACATQDDADVLFSDTEKEIIKTLVYSSPSGDATNAYINNSAAAALGQKFFFDVQFSGAVVVQGNRTSSFAVGTEKTISCATCHDSDFGFADKISKPNDVSLGANFTTRNAPTVLNTSFNTYSLWDGSADSVWSLNRAPIEGAPHNFHRYAVAYIICNSNTVARGDYRNQHDTIFVGAAGANSTTAVCGSLSIAQLTSANQYGKTAYSGLSATNQGHVDRIFANFSKAIGAYEHQLVSKNSAFDQWASGNENAMTVSQKRGLKIFITKGNCVRCHSGPNFADGSFHNLGVPQVGGLSGSNDQGRYSGISTLVSGSNATFNTVSAYNDSPSTDRVTGLVATDADIGKFKTPTLRSVNKTPPYFHNGTFASLWDVVNFYNFAGNGGNFPGTKDTRLTTRRMSNEEMEDLVNFLKALEGEALSSSLTSNTAPTSANYSW
ncbi:MAG: hypothetical protein JNJ69_09665 [Leptospiraceae bacterium]|nr:hypothetical protein [Leptospiraceae bacterium]